MLRQLSAALLGLALLADPARAKAPDEFTEIRSAENFQPRSDRAYLLFRVPRLKGAASMEPLFMRVPSAEENAAYAAAKEAAYAEALPKLTEEYQRAVEKHASKGDAAGPAPLPPSIDRFPFTWDEVANLSDVDFSDTLVKSSDENTYLVEVPAGEYVFYGLTPSMGLPRIVVCFCLGTVGFTAEAGEITDLGYVIGDLARSRSVVPELASESGYGPSSDVGLYVMSTGTVRPVRSDSSLPSGLDRAQIKAAQYQAVGRYITPHAMGINRLVPVPGVLDYDQGKVIDARTGKAVPDNF